MPSALQSCSKTGPSGGSSLPSSDANASCTPSNTRLATHSIAMAMHVRIVSVDGEAKRGRVGTR